MVIPPVAGPRYPTRYATWPELVAADLQGAEDGQASRLASLLEDAQRTGMEDAGSADGMITDGPARSDIS